MTEVEQPQTNGIDTADDENNKSRPADIEAVCQYNKRINLSKNSN